MSRRFTISITDHACFEIDAIRRLLFLNEILKECWKIYKNEDNDPSITFGHKLLALRIASEINDKKFGMFQNGPAIMQLGHLRDRVDGLRKQALGENNDNDTLRRSLSYRDLHHHDSDSP